jgi:hypothetical protein
MQVAHEAFDGVLPVVGGRTDCDPNNDETTCGTRCATGVRPLMAVASSARCWGRRVTRRAG